MYILVSCKGLNLGVVRFPVKSNALNVTVHYDFQKKVARYFKLVTFSALLVMAVTFCPPMPDSSNQAGKVLPKIVSV